MSREAGTQGAAGAHGWGAGAKDMAAVLRQRFPTVDDLARAARCRVPRFAFDYMAGGAGDPALGVARNRTAMEAVQIVPRYGLDVAAVQTGITLFGRQYAMPLGIAPMGMCGLIWPGADEILAATAQRANIPYVTSTVANAAMENLAVLAPDVWWYQLYQVPGRQHQVSLDLIRRAERAGAHTLVLTVDIPARQKRINDVRNGLAIPFRMTPRTLCQIAGTPAWALRMLKRGQPIFHNLAPYAGPNATPQQVAAYAHAEMGGALTWEWIARMREAWPRALVVKGIMHPDDAEQAVQLGADGVVVSNHGGRQLDAAPASIDVLPAILQRVGQRCTVLYDGSVRSGLDAVRALAVGAHAVLAGRAFLSGVGALGDAGGDHVTALFREELSGVMAQIGASDLESLRNATVLHPGALRFPDSAEPIPHLG